MINLLLLVITAAYCFCGPTQKKIFADQHLQAQSVINSPLNPGNLSSSPAVLLSTDDLIISWRPPLSTRGRYVVDANGIRFRMKAGNWHGASGTYLGRGDINEPSNHHAGEQAFQTPLCLDRTPLNEIVQSFLDLGINTIRLPFSNEMVSSTDIPPDSALRANPDLRGLTPLQIFDACIAALTKRGLAVILNNHTTRNLWCCGPDGNARWNSGQSEDVWEHDWIFMVKRYKDNARVIGAELRNEVRRDLLKDPTWGGGGYTDWWLASQNAGSRILREANPDILIMIEGINYVGVPTPYTLHWRPELQPVRGLSHTMPVLDKLVYAAHFYSYTGPNATGGPQFGTHDNFYRDLNSKELEAIVNDLAFYVATPLNEKQEHYTNPVFISETGSGGRNDFLQTDRDWWSHFTCLLIRYDIDFALWPLVGWHERARGDLWALNAWDAMGNLLSILQPGDWRYPAFALLIKSNGKTGVVKKVPQKRMLTSAMGSMQMSNRLFHHKGLNQPGDIKMSCPDGLRMSAISHDGNHTVICTDAVFGRQSSDESTHRIELIATPDSSKDGYSEWRCSRGSHMLGYSMTDSSINSIVCAQSSANQMIGARVGTRLVWLMKERKGRASQAKTLWHTEEARVANCEDHELLIGFVSSLRHSADPMAILCQTFNHSASNSRSSNGSRLSRVLRTIFQTYIRTLASKVPFGIL